MCATSKVAAYFQSGEMPGSDFYCAFEPANLGLTIVGTLAETIANYGLSNLID